VALHKRLAHNNLYKCDGCGKIGPWEDGWMWYGSVLHEETCPQDVPVACSEKCYGIVMEKIAFKEFVLPKLKNRGYYSDKISERIGY